MKKILLFSLALLLGNSLQAQLFVDNNYTANQMVHGFFDNSGIQILNVTYSGAPNSLSFFEGSQSNIGLNAGLLMTTGNVFSAIGPNDSESAGSSMGVPGSVWLDALIPGYTTHDASIIELDVVPNSDTLSFRYVFGSEEYKEFVNTQFNDVFAFLVEGPGLPTGDSIWVAPDTVIYQNNQNCYICVDTLIVYPDDIFCYYDSLTQSLVCDTIPGGVQTQWCYTDPNCVPLDSAVYYPGYWYVSPGGINIAEIPNSNLPVAINTLNQFINTQYFVDNAGGTTVQYDGFTTPLWAKLVVQAGQTYHVRIAIADAGDSVFDSGVFLGIESLGGDSLLAAVPQFLIAPPSNSNSTTVTFQNNSLWGTKYHWDFGDGTFSEERNPVHDYAVAGNYTVALTVQNWCSSKTFTQSVLAGVSAVQEPNASVFSAFPNPTNGAFTLDLKNEVAAQVRVASLDGRIVLDRQLADGAQIDLNQYGKGVYLLQVIANGTIYTEKMVNQ